MHQAPATLPAPPAYIFLRELVLRFWHAYSSYYDYDVLLDSRNASIAVCTVIESPPSSNHASLPRGPPAQALVCSRCSGSISLQTAIRGCLRSPHAVPFASLLSISRIIV